MNPRLYFILGAHCAAQVLSLAQAATPLPDSAIDSTETAYPVVITPTRLRQSLSDVPASVTIITQDTLRRYGITSIPEALRLVPGMAVARSTGTRWDVNYHGTYALQPRRMNVLVDGVSVYRPAVSNVEWSTLPVTMEDIDHIEVIRGTDSSAYGPNSMTAIINILTKHPKDVERAMVSVTAGSHHAWDTTLRVATTVGPTSLRATVNTERDGGYDRISLGSTGHDDKRLDRLNLRAQSDLSDGSSLDLQASYVGGLLQTDLTSTTMTSFPDRHVLDTNVSAKWTKALSANHELQVSGFTASAATEVGWNICVQQILLLPEFEALLRANPSYVLQIGRGVIPPTGGTAQDDLLFARLFAAALAMGPAAYSNHCGKTNGDITETRTQIEVQDTYVASDTMRFVAGAGMRYQRGISASSFNGAVGNTLGWVFGHAEIRPRDWLTVNVGGYQEHNSLSGNTFSPRFAVNARLSDSQTVRAVFSKGTRSPDISEQRSDWTYTVTDLTPPFNGATTVRAPYGGTTKGDLVPERITSVELGYLLVLRQLGLTLDARVFDDRLTHLIPNYNLDKIANEGAVRLTGAEVQANWELSRGWSGQMTYAYLLNRDALNLAETLQYSRHSGSIGVSRAISDTWRTSLSYYGASGDGLYELRYGRSDLTVSKSFKLGAQPGSVSLILSYLDTPTVSSAFKSSATSNSFTSAYDSRLRIQGALRLAF